MYKPLYKPIVYDTTTPGNSTPLRTTDARDKTFHLVEGVKIYGGFPNTGNPTITDRDATTNPTILSGDFNENDVVNASPLTITNNTENAYHVVLSVSDTNATILDGFTITGGNADDTGVITVKTKDISQNFGGGMHNYNSSPSITNCSFNSNNAKSGGGMYNEVSYSSIITNCSFSSNTAEYGGGMYNEEDSSPSITNCSFSSNKAKSGGGMYNCSSSPSITNSSFSLNTATFRGGGMVNDDAIQSITNCSFSSNTAEYGGGMYNDYSTLLSITNCSFSSNKAKSGGGMYNYDSSPSITNCSFSLNTATTNGGGMVNDACFQQSITNCSFSSNTAEYGGGMHNGSSAPLSITNVTFSSNKATNGGGMYNYDSSPNIYNSIFWDNKRGTTANANTTAGADIENDASTTVNVTLEHSLLQLVKNQTNYITTSTAKFTFATTDKNIYESQTTNLPQFVSATDLNITACSPAKDTGDNSKNTETNDLGTNDRIYNSVTIDMGAFENQDSYPSNPVLTSITPLSPANSDTGVAINSDLTITFNKDVNLGTGNIKLYKVGTATAVETFDVANPSGISISGATLTINPSNDLEKGETYYVNIANTAIRGCTQNFYAGISNDSDWKFTTVTSSGIIELSIQKAITPNGDGINDVLVIKNISSYPKITLQVFNRWGRRIYYSTNYQNNWDGKADGSNIKVPAGSYMFIITPNDSISKPTQGVIYVDY